MVNIRILGTVVLVEIHLRGIHSKVSEIITVSHNTYDTTYNELLSMNSDLLIHQRHLRFLITEVFKSVNNLKMNFFPYDLRKGNTLHLPLAHSARHGINPFFFSEVVFFGITFPEKLRKATSSKNLRND